MLLSIDESTYPHDSNTSHLPSQSFPDGYAPVSGVMGDHPMCWTHQVGGGILAVLRIRQSIVDV